MRLGWRQTTDMVRQKWLAPLKRRRFATIKLHDCAATGIYSQN
jgi:hypothetical protein